MFILAQKAELCPINDRISLLNNMKSRLFDRFPVKNIIKGIDGDIKRYGVSQAMNRVIKKCGTELEIVNKTEYLEDILK